jgi:voltage-gated potassium channel
VANDLKSHHEDFVVLEKDENLIEKNELDENVKFLCGDSTDVAIFEKTGIKKAKPFITCLPKDADNIYVELAAREFNKNILIVSRAPRSSAVSKLRMAGANNVIMPDAIGGSRMASLIANPDIMEFLDIIRARGIEGTNIESISYDELPAEL